MTKPQGAEPVWRNEDGAGPVHPTIMQAGLTYLCRQLDPPENGQPIQPTNRSAASRRETPARGAVPYVHGTATGPTL
jgi:hypothetical protein